MQQSPSDPPASKPADPTPPPRAEPGEVRPRRTTLAAPPSQRYRTEGARADAAGTGPRTDPLLAALGVVILGAVLLTILIGVLTETVGSVFVTVVAGGIAGLVLGARTLPAPPGARPRATWSRGRTTQVGAGLGAGMVALGAVLIWLLGRWEGGVLDPLTYLWTTFGFGVPFLFLPATLAAAWGASNGPVRGR